MTRLPPDPAEYDSPRAQIARAKGLDQPYIAGRCAELGLGIALAADTVTAAELRDAVRAVVEEPRYRKAAQEIAAELRGLDPLATAADLITTSLPPSEG